MANVNDGINPTASGSPADAITGGTLNLTKTSTYIAIISALAIGVNNVFDQLFPSSLNPTAGVKAALLIAVIAAWALIVCADILSRGLSHAGQPTTVIKAPVGLTAHLNGAPAAIYTVAAIRIEPRTDQGGSKKVSYLLVRVGSSSQWAKAKEITFD